MNTSKLKIAFAFLAVLIIWSTTPLAIQWSSQGAPITSALARMIIGVLFCFASLGLMSSKLPMDAASRKVYVVGGLSIFSAMSLFYMAAQLIPSGWVAVLFGLSPLATGIFSAMVEPESRLTPSRIIGLLLGFSGLYMVFSAGLNVQDASVNGVILVVIALIISSATSVITRQLVKPLSISGMQITTGSILVAIPFFMLAAWLTEPVFHGFSGKALLSILYLGVIGSGVGFTMYYFLLKHTSANRVALTTLITPICALSLGSWLNNEPIVAEVWLGAGLVCIGLLLYEFKPKLGLRRL